MTKVKAAGINADRLKSLVDRIEKLEEEQAALAGDKRDVYAEAKGVGYDVATMRKIVALRKKDAADRDEQDTLLDVYKHALGMLTNGPAPEPREPTEEELLALAGRIAGEVEQCLDLVGVDGQPPAIAAIQGRLGCSLGKASKVRGMVAEEISRRNAIEREMKSEEPARALPCATIWQEVTLTREEHVAAQEAERAAAAERRRIEREARAAEQARLSRLSAGDMPDFPAGFDRRQQVSP